MELLYHGNTEIDITEIRKFIINKELLSCENTEKISLLTKTVKEIVEIQKFVEGYKS